MSFLDTVKRLVSGGKKQTKAGIDKAADAVGQRVDDDKAEKVDKAADKAKDLVDKIPPEEAPK